jgi:hypothetical protein
VTDRTEEIRDAVQHGRLLSLMAKLDHAADLLAMGNDYAPLARAVINDTRTDADRLWGTPRKTVGRREE